MDFLKSNKANINIERWKLSLAGKEIPLDQEEDRKKRDAQCARAKIGRDFIQEIKNAPWLKKAPNDACNSDNDEVTMEDDADDDMYPFAIHLQQELTLEPRQQTCFYAKIVLRETHTHVENSAHTFAVRSCNLGPMVLAATV